MEIIMKMRKCIVILVVLLVTFVSIGCFDKIVDKKKDVEIGKNGNVTAESLMSYYSRTYGIGCGSNIIANTEIEENTEDISDYINKAEVICINFDVGGCCGALYSGEILVIDLTRGRVLSNHESEDYSDFQMSEELSNSEIESIREEFPKHIDENKKTSVSGNYSYKEYYRFDMQVFGTDGSVKNYRGEIGDACYPGFDEYWKSIYKECFGKEYE